MGRGLSIRPYRPADEVRVWEIHERATRAVDAFANPDGVEGGVATDPAEHARKSRVLADRGVFLVGEVEREGSTDVDSGAPSDQGSVGSTTVGGAMVVAMGAIDPSGGAGTAQPDATAELTRMRVDPDHWRRGYGRELLKALERAAREHGWTTLVLETLARQEAARSLYEGAGYEPVDREVVGEYDVRRYRKTLVE